MTESGHVHPGIREALQALRRRRSRSTTSTPIARRRDGRRPECKACNLAAASREVPREPAAGDRTGAALAARESGAVPGAHARVRRERQEEDLGPQEPPEAEVRAHARAVRRDARGAGRRVRDLPPAPARGTHAARRPRSRHRRDPRVAVLHLQQRARRLPTTSPSCSTPRPSTSTGTTSSTTLAQQRAAALVSA